MSSCHNYTGLSDASNENEFPTMCSYVIGMCRHDLSYICNVYRYSLDLIMMDCQSINCTIKLL